MVLSGQVDFEAHQKYHLRLLEGCLFLSTKPLSLRYLTQMLQNSDEHAQKESIISQKLVHHYLLLLKAEYSERGINLRYAGGEWFFCTAPDLALDLPNAPRKSRKLSRPAIEVLGIIAYHQPVTRTDIETIRGSSMTRGTLDLLIEIGWVKAGRRRETPGRPVTYVTTSLFLQHFDLQDIKDLPGLEELKKAGFLDKHFSDEFICNHDLPLTDLFERVMPYEEEII